MNSDPTLLRLRASNPVPEASGGEYDHELFARITAGRPEEAAAARRRYRRPLLVVALAFVAVAVLTSTAFAISQWFGGDVVKPDVTRAEYEAAKRQLTLPPGYGWPKLHVDPNSVTTRGGGGGHAVLLSELAWDCYWVDAIHRGDTKAQVRARTYLTGLMRNNVIVAPVGAPEDWVPANPPNGPYAVFAHDGGYEWLQQVYALAAAGHPERLAQRCRANSPG